jgi:hypothetical protein
MPDTARTAREGRDPAKATDRPSTTDCSRVGNAVVSASSTHSPMLFPAEQGNHPKGSSSLLGDPVVAIT